MSVSMNNQNSKISIIIPVYNVEQYISRCIDSLLNQVYEDLEFIFIDDGSIDNSGRILDERAAEDKRIKVIHKKNGGVTSARLEGVKSATGEWIGFVDGDDYIEPDMYSRLINNAINNNALISHCGYQMVFPSRKDYYHDTGVIKVQDHITGLKDLLSGTLIEPGIWNKIYHKSLFEKLLHSDKMDYNIKINEDLLMNYYLFNYCEASVFEDFCPYHYIVRLGSAANSEININKLLDPLKVRKIIQQDCTSNKELKTIADSLVLRQLISLATFSCKDNKALILPNRKAARKEIRSSLFYYLKGSFSIKEKLSCLWVSVWPASYAFVHYVYSKITGLDKIYEVS